MKSTTFRQKDNFENVESDYFMHIRFYNNINTIYQQKH